MAQIRPVPDRPPRALGIVRVSKERDEMISPEIQRVAIADHCARSGYVLADVVEALDESGSQRRSPWWRKLDEAVAQVEGGNYQVIVVWKFSRAARQRLRWAVALDRVEVAGGRLESATEPVDVSTSAGRLARGVLAEFNAFEAERIGDVWREVQARRLSRGLPVNGKPRFGYLVVDGSFVPDPDTGPVLAALYQRYVAGESMYGLVGWLNGEGIRTVGGYSRVGPGPWSQESLRKCLDSGFGAGLLLVAGIHQSGAHEPVIADATWQAYRAARIARRPLRRSERSEYLLSGMVRCQKPLADGSLCGSTMGGGRFGSSNQAKFRCAAYAQQRRHTGGYVSMATVDAAVMDFLRALAADVDAKRDDLQSPVRPRRKRQADGIARELAELEQQLVHLTRQHARGIVPESAYSATRAEIEEEQLLLTQRHAQALAAATSEEAGPIAAALLLDWPAITIPRRRAVLRQLVRHVDVTPARPQSIVVVVPAFDG